MATGDSIDQALALLNDVKSDPAEIPAMVMPAPPASDGFLIGNKSGLIRLAIASLNAAKGEKQSFKTEPWFYVEDIDWGVEGLKLDESAHIYLPVKKTRFRKIRESAVGWVLVTSFLVCLVVGFATIVRWFLR